MIHGIFQHNYLVSGLLYYPAPLLRMFVDPRAMGIKTYELIYVPLFP